MVVALDGRLRWLAAGLRDALGCSYRIVDDASARNVGAAVVPPEMQELRIPRAADSAST
jgi:hypothetical protein